MLCFVQTFCVNQQVTITRHAPLQCTCIMIRCYAPRCPGQHAPIPGGQHTTYTWANASSCTMCPRIGYCCMDNCTLRKAMETCRQLRNHHYKQHFQSGAVNAYPMDSLGEDSESMVAMQSTPNVPLIVLHGITLQTFLTTSKREGTVMAIHHLVCGACFNTNNFVTGYTTRVP